MGGTTNNVTRHAVYDQVSDKVPLSRNIKNGIEIAYCSELGTAVRYRTLLDTGSHGFRYLPIGIHVALWNLSSSFLEDNFFSTFQLYIATKF